MITAQKANSLLPSDRQHTQYEILVTQGPQLQGRLWPLICLYSRLALLSVLSLELAPELTFHALMLAAVMRTEGPAGAYRKAV